MAKQSEALGAHGVRLVVAYDGTSFHGYQEQPGLRTVQGVLSDAIARLDPDHGKLRAASRTDAGVHAMGQVIAFDSTRLLPSKGWSMQLNQHLPHDLAVREAEACAPDYDPRRDSLGKLYRYRLYVGLARDPLRYTRAWHVRPGQTGKSLPPGTPIDAHLDLEAMRDAARRLEGTHDFRAFRSADDERLNTVRTLRAVRIVPGYADDADGLAIEVDGNAFMKNMVRILTGTLVEVGRGRMDPARIHALLGPDARREDAGPTAPSCGLALVGVRFGRIAALAAAAPEPALGAAAPEPA